MDKLKNCAIEYSNLLNKNFIYKLSNGEIIEIFFKPDNFCHLIGLHKLKDLRTIQRFNEKKLKSKTLYNKIIKDKFTLEDIKRSAFYKDMEARMDNFNDINLFTYDKVIIDFDKSKINTKLKSEKLFFRQYSNYYTHLALAKDLMKKFYPETFLVEKSDLYVKEQDKLEIIEIQIIDSRTRDIKYAYTSENLKAEEKSKDEAAATVIK